MLLNCGVGEDPWESLWQKGDPTSPPYRKSVLNGHWKNWCWSWNSSILATWCHELPHWERPWCSERLKVGGEGHGIGWDGWMASPTQWTWVWVNSGSWWWTGRAGMLQSMGSQRVRHDWVTELNWTELNWIMSDVECFFFSCVCKLSGCLLWRNVSLDPLSIFWLGSLFFYSWATWAACVFWRLILCQLLHFQLFSSIMLILFFNVWHYHL